MLCHQTDRDTQCNCTPPSGAHWVESLFAPHLLLRSLPSRYRPRCRSLTIFTSHWWSFFLSVFTSFRDSRTSSLCPRHWRKGFITGSFPLTTVSGTHVVLRDFSSSGARHTLPEVRPEHSWAFWPRVALSHRVKMWVTLKCQTDGLHCLQWLPLLLVSQWFTVVRLCFLPLTAGSAAPLYHYW